MRTLLVSLVLAAAAVAEPTPPPKVVVAGFEPTIEDGVPKGAKPVGGVSSHVFGGAGEWDPWAELPRLYLHRALSKVTHGGRKLELIDAKQLEELLNPPQKPPEKPGAAPPRPHMRSRLADAQERKIVADKLGTALIVDGTMRLSMEVEESVAQRKGDVGFRTERIVCNVELQFYDRSKDRLIQVTETFEGSAVLRKVIHPYRGEKQETERDDEAPRTAMDEALRRAVASSEVKRLLFGE